MIRSSFKILRFWLFQNDVDEKYEILNVIEFTSTRKRMSVVVRTPEGKLTLMVKGAVSEMSHQLYSSMITLEVIIIWLNW